MSFTLRPYRRFPFKCSRTYNAGPLLKPLMAYFSGFGSLMALLVLSSGQAYGEWVSVDRDDRTRMTLYVDPNTIHRRGELVEMWALYDYKTAQPKGGDSYLSRKIQSVYDCNEGARREISVKEFSGNMGTGEVVHVSSYLFSAEPKWIPVRSGSVGETLWKVACGKQ